MKKTVKKRGLMERTERIISDLVLYAENIPCNTSDSFLQKREAVKMAMDFLALKQKKMEGEESGRMFRAAEEDE